MSGLWRRLRRSPLVAPLLFAAFPVVYLWASNARNQIRIVDVAFAFMVAFATAGACYALCRLGYRDAARASVASTMLVFMIFSFGHLVGLASVSSGSVRMRLLLVAYGLLAAAGLVVIARSAPTHTIIGTLNLIGVVLVAMNVPPIVSADFSVDTSVVRAGDQIELGDLTMPEGGGRDVYYLIFDRYANERTLATEYGFDNGPFLASLEDRGFTVVHDAVANYPGTAHSLASSLNLTYLDDLAERMGRDSDDWQPIYASLAGSVAMRGFEELGYRTIHIGSWWGPTFIDPSADQNYVSLGLRDFSEVFVLTSIAPYIANEFGVGPFRDAYTALYERIGFQADAIAQVANDPGPTFTFAHFLLPHNPYIFDADGDFVPSGTGPPVEQAYIDQLQYTNTLIDEITEDLLAGSAAEDPIVILQSDEGPHAPADESLDPGYAYDWATEPQENRERKLRILDAYYFPDGGSGNVDPTVTPINTFRAIFDRYFGADLPLLADRSYIYEWHERPYQFVDVTKQLHVGAR